MGGASTDSVRAIDRNLPRHPPPLPATRKSAWGEGRSKRASLPAPLTDSIVKQRARVIAPILCGAGYAVVRFFPPAKCRGDGAPDGAPVVSLAAHRCRCAGACRRSIAAISLPRVRVSWDEALAPVPVQRAPRGAVVMPPDRLPRRPGCGATNPARGRRTNRTALPPPVRQGLMPHLRHITLRVAPSSDVSRRRPRPGQARRSMKGQCGGNMEFIPIDLARESAAAGTCGRRST